MRAALFGGWFSKLHADNEISEACLQCSQIISCNTRAFSSSRFSTSDTFISQIAKLKMDEGQFRSMGSLSPVGVVGKKTRLTWTSSIQFFPQVKKFIRKSSHVVIQPNYWASLLVGFPTNCHILQVSISSSPCEKTKKSWPTFIPPASTALAKWRIKSWHS